MHPSAMYHCKLFFDTYAPCFQIRKGKKVRILEIGSQNVNGSLRQVAPGDFEYIGVDFVAGNGVDLVLEDPYKLPFKTGSIDLVLASSCFEHSQFFWLLFLEIMRVLKPKGLFYLNAPSNGRFHRYPVDCWRFYPDSGQALVEWAKRNKINAELLESYTGSQLGPQPEELMWNDFVAVFLKNGTHLSSFPDRILHKEQNIRNGILHGHNGFLNYTDNTEDQIRIFLAQRAGYPY